MSEMIQLNFTIFSILYEQSELWTHSENVDTMQR